MTDTMSPSAKQGMTVAALKRRMVRNSIPSGYRLAKVLGMSASTTSRWLRGVTTIDVRAAALIREKLPLG